ncbi:MAG: hypothetical protein ACI9QD_001025 [Thermoproteota archaeon]|jgi:hypothetical protein
MKKLSVIIASILLLSITAHASCLSSFETKLLKKERRKDMVIGASIGLGALALMPIFTPLAAAVLGGTAVTATGVSLLDRLFKSKGKARPQALKMYTVIHNAVNGATNVSINRKADSWLMGRRTQISYAVSSQEIESRTEKFVDDVQYWIFSFGGRCRIIQAQVLASVARLDKRNAFCKIKKNRKTKVLGKNKIMKLVSLDICDFN